MALGRVVVVMGVSGAGKTTLGRALADRGGFDFQEGDDLHPPANRAKMASGRPLTDADRAPWLDRIAAWVEGELHAGRSGVIACSVLKRAYRARIGVGRPRVALVFLNGPREVLARRLAARRGHFMPPQLLDSQLADLEPPSAAERPIVIDIRQPLAAQVDAVLAALDADPQPPWANPG
jgi:gluconokinase